MAQIHDLKLGSPPRGRGKDAVQRHTARRVGITPAWAGKRLTRPAMTGTPKDHPRVGGKRGRCCPDRLRCWDHPRVGGEKRPAFSMMDSVSGSPPRGRGKALVVKRGDCAVRITPAWAGKRAGKISPSGKSWDHPRVGGEKKLRIELSQPHAGSPPHGRGKVAHKVLNARPDGITPA